MAITINVNLDEILAALKNDLDFTGNADKYIKVNATADGFEFAAVSGGGGGTWGSITGTLSDQTDLQSALDAKYDASNPSGYITGIAWGAITGTLSSQTDLQSALDLKANLAGASFTGDVSVTTSGSGDTLQLTNSGSGTTLNLLNSGSGDFFAIDTNKLVVSNNGNLAVDTNTLFVDAVNNFASFGATTRVLNENMHVTGGAFVNGRFWLRTPAGSYGLDYTANGIFDFNPNERNDVDVRFRGDTDVAAMFVDASADSVGFGTQSPTAKIDIRTNSTSKVGAIIQAAAGQTANLLEVKNSGGTNLFHITASGGIATNGNAGFTGTGSYTNFTIENGIITAAS